MVEKLKDDVWCSNPPQVTSYIACPHSGATKSGSVTTLTSPICGFGWRFELHQSFNYQTSNSNSRVQELVGQTTLLFQPHMCSSMPLRNVVVTTKVYYPDAADPQKIAYERVFSDVAIRSSTEHDIGTYSGPPQYSGRAHFLITVAFSPLDGLSLPNSPCVNTKKVLRRSLDAPSFVDTKFYLFSRNVDGRPACPKALFANSELLKSSSSFLKDLLSQESGFSNSTPCDLFEDTPEELDKLDADAFEYDSDSDLDDDEPELVSKGKGKDLAASTSGETSEVPPTEADSEKLTSRHPVSGRAFAVNGTAHKTWKAFIYYTYTNDIIFSPLKSRDAPAIIKPTGTDLEDMDPVSCSPKSMYRFADYADIPALKSLAKGGIKKSLSNSNIINELFSSFTRRYQEIIELEVDFLVANFTPEVAHQLDEMLRVIVCGTKPDSFRVLAFTMRRLRGDSKEEAWCALDSPIDFISSFSKSTVLKRQTVPVQPLCIGATSPEQLPAHTQFNPSAPSSPVPAEMQLAPASPVELESSDFAPPEKSGPEPVSAAYSGDFWGIPTIQKKGIPKKGKKPHTLDHLWGNL